MYKSVARNECLLGYLVSWLTSSSSILNRTQCIRNWMCFSPMWKGNLLNATFCLEHQAMDDVQKPSNLKCYVPLWEALRNEQHLSAWYKYNVDATECKSVTLKFPLGLLQWYAHRHVVVHWYSLTTVVPWWKPKRNGAVDLDLEAVMQSFLHPVRHKYVITVPTVACGAWLHLNISGVGI
jgi:hypothetical protein